LGSRFIKPICVLGLLSPGVNRPQRAADHSPPSRAEIKNAWSYTSTSSIRQHGMVFSYAQGQYTHTHILVDMKF